jgi:hypothetical protein
MTGRTMALGVLRSPGLCELSYGMRPWTVGQRAEQMIGSRTAEAPLKRTIAANRRKLTSENLRACWLPS